MQQLDAIKAKNAELEKKMNDADAQLKEEKSTSQKFQKDLDETQKELERLRKSSAEASMFVTSTSHWLNHHSCAGEAYPREQGQSSAGRGASEVQGPETHILTFSR